MRRGRGLKKPGRNGSEKTEKAQGLKGACAFLMQQGYGFGAGPKTSVFS